MKRVKEAAFRLRLAGWLLKGAGWLTRLVGRKAVSFRGPARARGFDLVRLGTRYGGWTLVDTPSLLGARILSAGLGEDASFDVAFAKRYRATVIILDPTPRAIDHFNQVVAATKGVQPAPSPKPPDAPYDLEGLQPSQLVLDPSALWDSCGTISFYPPRSEEDVSHSIVDYQHRYARDPGSALEVPATTVRAAMLKHEIDPTELELLKLNIEGAEVEVLQQMLADGIYPKQLLVAYVELNRPTRRALGRARATNRLLRDHGYQMLGVEPPVDFLYVRRAAIGRV